MKANSSFDRYVLPELDDLVEADKYSKNMKDFVLLKKFNRSISKHEKKLSMEQEYFKKKNEEHIIHVKLKQDIIQRVQNKK